MNELMERRLAETLVAVFDDLFEKPLGTVLRGGADEPFYEPGSPSTVWFRYTIPAVHSMKYHIGVLPVRHDGDCQITAIGMRPRAVTKLSRQHFLLSR